MKTTIPIARDMAALRRALAQFHDRGETVALVPTMGALHAGHLALVRRAQRLADRVVVSIFVNPTQFAPHEDLATYPRPFAADVAALGEVAADLVWAPSAKVMYPEGFATRIVPAGAASVGLEDAFRPHFFGGVATVVAKLLIQCMPDTAVFGQKDYQQLKVITQMTRDLALPVKIVGAPIVREKDGLALSSRNVYLSADQRAAAPALYRSLSTAAARIASGDTIGKTLKAGRRDIEKAGFAIDYLEARHAETLAPVRSAQDGPLRLLVAAKLGRTRLIDNVAVPRS
jgi:pantoate--beta-alanine ligase